MKIDTTNLESSQCMITIFNKNRENVEPYFDVTILKFLSTNFEDHATKSRL